MLFFLSKPVSEAGQVTSANWRVRDGELMLGSWSDHARIHPAIFFLILECYFAWQAQYLVKLQGESCCSAHCK